MKIKSLLLIISLLTCYIANSQSVFNPPKEIGIYEKLDSILPDDVVLFDKDSTQVNLKSLINKPTIISFVYYDCPGICSPLLDGVAEVIERTELELGIDYQVITISFNQDDTPGLGKKKKKNYVATIKRNIDESQWIWLTGDSLNIKKITDAVGFKFKRDGKDFIHPASIMAISPKGKITRYLYGTDFLPFDVKMAIVEAADERSGPTINKLLKFCFSYDSESKKYMFNITSISGSIIIILVLIFLFTVLLKKQPIKINKI